MPVDHLKLKVYNCNFFQEDEHKYTQSGALFIIFTSGRGGGGCAGTDSAGYPQLGELGYYGGLGDLCPGRYQFVFLQYHLPCLEKKGK